MQKYTLSRFYSTILILFLISLFSLNSSAHAADGLFGTYFENMTGPCTNGFVLTGFNNSATSTFGTKTCTSIKDLIGAQYAGEKAQAGQAMLGFNLDGTLSFGPVNWVRVGSNISYNAGNVGIGTILPRTKLDVAGEIVATNRLTLAIDTSITSPTWSIDNNADTFRIFRQPNITTAGIPFVNILNNGNVGIGTNNPALKLDVNGDIQIKNSGILYSPGRMHINGEEVLYLLNKGGVNISTAWGGNGNLTVGGKTYSKEFIYTSDERLKKNINTLTDAESTVIGLRGVIFDWKDSSKHDIGFIAQEVEKVVPTLVDTNTEGYKSVKYGNITAILVEALKSQIEKNKVQEKQIQSLEIRLDAIEKNLQY